MSEQINKTVEERILELLESKRYPAIKELLAEMNPSDIAALFDEIKKDAQIPLLFRLIPKELAADAFVEMDPEDQELLIKGFSDKELKQVVDELFVDDAVDIVEEMPANVVKRILSQVDPDFRKEINEILRYPEDSAGSVMTTEYVSLRPNMTVAEAIQRIRKTGIDKETIYTCYVTEKRKLIGVVTVRELLAIKDDDTLVSDFMEENVISIQATADQEDAAKMMSKYNFIALPVVDSDNRMVGIVTVDDAMDVIEEETTEDLQIMAGITPIDTTYIRSNPFELFKSRIPWLLLLMISATFTSMIINKFEASLAAQVVLTAYIPMIMDTAGNSGSQSSTTVIRAISLDEVEFKDLPIVVWKEIRTAVLCGIALATLCFIKLMTFDRLVLGNVDLQPITCLAICVTMALTVLIAKTVGSTLPILAKKVGLDPAVMANPFITTIVDALSLLIYFAITSALLF